MIRLLVLVSLGILGPVEPYANCTCALQEVVAGNHSDAFLVEFHVNAEPNPGEAHGDGRCNRDCQRLIGNGCTVNGVLCVENNWTHDVVVAWASQAGGVTIQPGKDGQYTTGFVRIDCDHAKHIDFSATNSQLGVPGRLTFLCNPCSVPPAD